MKKKDDPRHKMRTVIVKGLFAKSFLPNTTPKNTKPLGNILKYQEKIDNLIAQNAPAWPIEQISPIDLATLRLAVWELLFKKKKEPYKVVVDEAVEIAKEYGSKSSAAFVNGVLGSIIKSQPIISKERQRTKT